MTSVFFIKENAIVTLHVRSTLKLEVSNVVMIVGVSLGTDCLALNPSFCLP